MNDDRTRDKGGCVSYLAPFEKDYAAALRSAERAAGLGHAKAKLLTAQFYAYGLGAGADEARAFRWYLAAARNGQATAQVEIAKRYRGLGRSTEALSWSIRAAEAGNPAAMRALASHYGARGDLAEAYAWSALSEVRAPPLPTSPTASLWSSLQPRERAAAVSLLQQRKARIWGAMRR